MINDDPPYLTRSGFRLMTLIEQIEYLGHVTVEDSGVKEGASILSCYVDSMQREALEWTEEQAVVYLAAKTTHDYLRSLYTAKTKQFYPAFLQSRDFVYRLFMATTYATAFPGGKTGEDIYQSIASHLLDASFYHPAYTRTLKTIQQFLRQDTHSAKIYASPYRLREFALNLIDALRRTRSNTRRVKEELDALIYVLSLFH